MKMTFITMVAVLSLLVTMATAQATSYTSSGNVSGNFTFSGFDVVGESLSLKISNIAFVGTPVINLPTTPGLYDWSLGVNNFAVDLNGGGNDFSIGSLGTFDIGTYTLPPLSSPGSANLGNVNIPFSLFGQGPGSLQLNNLIVGWSNVSNTTIDFTITATDMTALKGYLTQLDSLAHQSFRGSDGIASGKISFDGSLTAAPVPEPGTFVLLGLGLAGLGAIARRRNKKA